MACSLAPVPPANVNGGIEGRVRRCNNADRRTHDGVRSALWSLYDINADRPPVDRGLSALWSLPRPPVLL